jgi:hypothetical protein
MKPFGYYLTDNYKDINYKHIYENIYNFISKNNIYKLYDTFIDKNIDNILDIGVKFHRNKIILEKITYKNDINEIYKIDKYVEELQEKMCNIVYDYINEFIKIE